MATEDTIEVEAFLGVADITTDSSNGVWPNELKNVTHGQEQVQC